MTDDQREELLDGWEAVARGWGRQAETWAADLAPVTAAMLAAAPLAPGKRVLELAAGPGELSIAAARQVAPTKVLCSDGVEAMLDVAREWAAEREVTNLEFQRLALEWIDLPAAGVDVILCRYGLMLAVDSEAAARECRRVLATDGTLVAAVHGARADNPWMTTPGLAAESLGLTADGHDPAGPAVVPGPFDLSGEGQLSAVLEAAGFVDVQVSDVGFHRSFRNALAWLGEKVDQSPSFARLWQSLGDDGRARLRRRLEELAEEFGQLDGSLRVPGTALVATAET